MRALALALLLPLAAAALPKAGQTFPDLKGNDITGHPKDTKVYEGKPTLVVAISDRGAGDAEKAWWDAADKKVPDMQRLSIISLHVPFFVSEDYARGQARDKVPRQYWDDNLLDTNGHLGKQLGLPDDHLPTVFVLDSKGKIQATFHGKVEDPGAVAIWKALPGPG